MASGLFFDPLVALRAAPLVSSTCTLLYAWDQHLFLSTLNRPETRKLSGPVVSPYFKVLFRRAIYQVLGFLAVTASTSIANLYSQRPLLNGRGSASWYKAGAILSASHILFVPIIANSVKSLVEDTHEDDSNGTLDRWLSINAIRGLTVDLGAWLACVVAVGKTLVA